MTPLGVAARGGAFIAALELLAQASVPIGAFTLGTKISWLFPLGIGLLVAAARGPARRALRRRVRPALVAGATEQALLDVRGVSDARADEVFWRVHLAERVMLSSGPAVLGAFAATAVALGLLAHVVGTAMVLAAGALLVALLAARAALSRRLDPRMERLASTRARVGDRIAAAARDAGEIRSPTARAAFLEATGIAASAWTDAEAAVEVGARTQRYALAAIAVAGAISAWMVATGTGPTALASIGTRGLAPESIRLLAVALAALSPAITLLRGYDEVAADREQLRLADAHAPAIVPPPFVIPGGAFTQLQARGLSVRYGTQPALADVTFDVPLHGVTAIAGPNGAGKSTLARAIAGVQAAGAGTIQIDGLDAASVDPTCVALVPQHPVLVEAMTVAENVRLVCPTATDSSIAAALAALGLDVDLARRCGALSRGEQRRIAIARALLSAPRLLVLDEPDAWLDARGRESLAEILRRESATRAIVVASHRADLLRWVDRVVLLGPAHSVEDVGSPDALARRSPVFASLIRDVADEALALGAEGVRNRAD